MVQFVVEAGHFYLLPKHVNNLVGPNQLPLTQIPQDLTTGEKWLLVEAEYSS